MIDKIVVVTPPDDVYQLGQRVLTVDLSSEQLNEVSQSIQNLDIDDNIIVYVWRPGLGIEWLLDKIYKSNAIIFNADSVDQTLVGFLSAQRKSAYFGDLRSLKEVNKSVIFNKDQCINFLNKTLGLYE